MAIPNLWRTKKQRYSLQADVCIHCDKIMFPPREVCPHCHKAARQKAAAPFVALMPVAPVGQLCAALCCGWRRLMSERPGHIAMTGRGEIYSFTTMYNVPKGFDEQKPYSVALIRLDDGPMVTAQLTDVDAADLTIGMRVEMVTRKLREEGDEGQIIYGYKFRPVLITG
jgi:uncharacterized OB-fold protein